MPVKYPNQKHITVFKEPCSSKNIYAMINIEAMKNAAQQLKPAAFKLWMYFAKNQQHYELDLSSKVVESEFGMKKDMYDNAVHELIDKGFLILQQGKTIYHFYELPSPLHMPKVVKIPAEKQESTTSNNTNNETGCGPNTPFQGVSSLPKNQTKSDSLDAAGNKLPARDKTIPSISAYNLYWKLWLRRHDVFYVKYLGDNVVQFPSGKLYRVLEDPYYDLIHVNYESIPLKDLRAAELAKATKPA